MAYQGYLIKAGEYTIPHWFISAETYKVTRCGQDLNSGRAESGRLHRQALDNFVPKVEFETVPLINDKDMESVLSNIRANYIDAVEQNFMARIWVPMINDYMEQEVYIPDIEFPIYFADENMVQYEKVKFEFIGYGKED